MFEGLDTFVHVHLNGEHVASSDNAFVPLRVSLEGKRAGKHTLLLHFESPAVRAMQLRREHVVPGVKSVCSNGDPSRLYTRKPQYHFGWDWGPTLISVGPWRPVRLDRYAGRIAEL